MTDPSTRTPPMTEEQRDDLIDLLPDDMHIWDAEEEIPRGFGGDFAWWSGHLGHPRSPRGFCTACGRGGTCLASAFHDALVSSVVRELDRLGALRQPATVDANQPGDIR